jgi:hypothetical protein
MAGKPSAMKLIARGTGMKQAGMGMASLRA